MWGRELNMEEMCGEDVIVVNSVTSGADTQLPEKINTLKGEEQNFLLATYNVFRLNYDFTFKY